MVFSAMPLRACATPIAHGVGSYKKSMPCLLLKTSRGWIHPSRIGVRDDRHAASRSTLNADRSSLHAYRTRKSRLSSLPLGFLGSVSVKTTRLGHLKPAMC